MGFDIQMREPPSAAEMRAAKQDADAPGYYRFNVSAMPVMAALMTSAGILSEDPVVQLPLVPPITLDAERRKLVEDGVYDAASRTALSPAERAFATAYRVVIDVMRARPSPHAGMVSAYKFQANDGYIVTPAECTVVATKLRAYASAMTQAELDKLDRLYRAKQAAFRKAIAQPGETVLLPDGEGLGLSLADARAWIEDWASYNALAARHGGYEID